MIVALFGVAVPVLWLGLIMILVFAVNLRLLPAGGAGTPLHLLLPPPTLGASAAGILARMTRAAGLEGLGSDYRPPARAKGLRGSSLLAPHVPPPAVPPLLTIL